VDSFHAIIPAGGAGTRLWPLSRSSRPKFLLDLTGSGRSLLQQTWDRLVTLVPPDNIHVVTGAAHAPHIHEQLPELTNIYVEPAPRDSMPAIGLAAAVIEQRSPGAVVGSFAADQTIADTDGFAAAVREAVAVAETKAICTVGVTPRGPSTAFGYIEAAGPLGVADAPSGRAVARFVEKPDAETAATYVAGGKHFWNAGMFVTRSDVLLAHLERLQPALHAGLSRIAEGWDSDTRDATLQEVWPSLTKIAIDHAVAEPVSLEGGIAVVTGDFGWDDIGDFAALHDHLPVNPDVVWVDADGIAIAQDGAAIAVVGIPQAVVVRTEDAVLVTTVEHAQRVKDVVAELKERGRTDLV
jgi:mannose-1-phosphate guanylyltransferase